jgi:hypothetical protein
MSLLMSFADRKVIGTAALIKRERDTSAARTVREADCKTATKHQKIQKGNEFLNFVTYFS